MDLSESFPLMIRGLGSEELAALQPDLGDFGHKLFVKLLETTSSNADFESVLRRCEEKKELFTSESFPPSKFSLFFPLDSPNSKQLEARWAGYGWKRVNEFPGYNNPVIFLGDITPNEITQGTLADTYFLSALSVLAERPALLKSLFVSIEPNKAGVYAVKMYKNGIEKILNIDNYFPCTSEGKLAFSHSKENELWVMLLEKAWARLHSSYALVDKNEVQIDSILETLTGAYCSVINHDDENLWDYLIEAKDKGWIISASAASTKASKELLEEMGLAGNFAYSILDVRSVDLKDSAEKIIQLRNPWGTKEWTGEWSDSSNIWTEELRAKLSWRAASSAEEKVFWMSYADFSHYFSRVQICKVDAECLHTSLPLSLARRPSCVRLQVNKPGVAFVAIHQPDNKYYEYKKYKYLLIRLIIAKLNSDGEEYKYIDGNMKMDRELCEEYFFDEGTYLLYIETETQASKDPDNEKHRGVFRQYKNEMPITLSLYSPQAILLKADEWDKHPQFLEMVYSSCAAMYGEHLTYDSEGAPQCSKYSGMRKEGYGFTYFENNSEDATIKEAVTYTMFDGLELVPPFKGTSYEVSVPPKSSTIVLMRQTSITRYNLSFSYISNITFTTEAMQKRIKKYGNKVTRKDPHVNGDIDICVYTLKHGGGICYLYENLTKNSILEEHVKFKTNGLRIVGEERNEMTIKIGPGESKFIELRAETSNWNIQTSVSYGISPARKSTDDMNN
eukprot:TRINITY_DN2170_c0_g5_i6.p1 TRINITY_DN2170_c0_g5~~TRINITY_DN2170_c0_g5_i6.p1  ORF type:complete len:732 (+),score=188.21 TRINITY_DN2170_c0_g5_i6:115-2310(+)